MDRENIVSEVAKVWDRRAMENELTQASVKIMAQHVEIEQLRAALRMLYDEMDEYQRINNLNAYNNHVMRHARAVLKGK
jgi:uncharacterized coiled-coil protein SlyX